MEMAGGTDQAKGLNLFHDMRFMVFKVKKRAAINYFKQTDQALDDGKFNTSFFLGGSEIGSETEHILTLSIVITGHTISIPLLKLAS